MPVRPALVIAHRGASGYLPEHTLEAKALAYAMGADFLEQDVVLTRDDVPIVLHDIQLDTVSDVAVRFPGRSREDGRDYAIDFTLDEIRTLRVNERINIKTRKPVYPRRFPAGQGQFTIPTLAEELEMIGGLNRSTGRTVGIYPEIKKPAWHRRQGKDISRIVLQQLHEKGYRTREDAVFVQCFDPAETRRLREELGSSLRLIQLIGENDWAEAETDFVDLRSPAGLDHISGYAQGIGPRIEHVITGISEDGKPQLTELVRDAHARKLQVHPYTFRSDDLPKFAPDFDSLVRMCVIDAGIDGLFTDFPDQVVQLQQRWNRLG